MTEPAILQVYQAGELTVVGFGDRQVLDDINVADCRDEVTELVKACRSKTLAFDLTGVKVIPSGLLGLLASLRRLGVNVHLYNPSEDVVEVLEVTKLDRLMQVHELEL